MGAMSSSTTTSAPAPLLRPWQRALVWAVVLAALLAVFALYLQPQFMITLADQVWACL